MMASTMASPVTPVISLRHGESEDSSGPETYAYAAHARKPCRRGFGGAASGSESRKRRARGETTPSANSPNADIEAIGNPTRRIFDRAHGAHAERSPNGLQYRAPPEFGTEGSNTRRWIPWPRYRPGIAAASRPTRADPV